MQKRGECHFLQAGWTLVVTVGPCRSLPLTTTVAYSWFFVFDWHINKKEYRQSEFLKHLFNRYVVKLIHCRLDPSFQHPLNIYIHWSGIRTQKQNNLYLHSNYIKWLICSHTLYFFKSEKSQNWNNGVQKWVWMKAAIQHGQIWNQEIIENLRWHFHLD